MAQQTDVEGSGSAHQEGVLRAHDKSKCTKKLHHTLGWLPYVLYLAQRYLPYLMFKELGN